MPELITGICRDQVWRGKSGGPTITVRGISCSDGRVHYQTPGELEHPYGSTTVENLTSNYQLVEAGK